ncbi:MAG: ATP-dependent helicase [Thermoprotei archaeon]|nr:MAG: ATP-dependent helicase [Thermoprotei archaeon]
MISIARKRYSISEVLKVLHPLVAEWFINKFEKLTPPQEYAIIPIQKGKNVLVSSPTGTGKTLAAFLTIISELIKLAEKNRLENRVYAVYISPLRALSNDIYRNLETPLREIKDIARKRGIELQEIRHAVRTGDTQPYVKQKMLRQTPHILITTPESLAIVLVAPKFREKLRNVRWVIVDEIHSLCENKRGVHLSLSLERLQNMVEKEFTRIGLSATINPLEEVAKFLVGYRDDGMPRDCLIVDTSYVKKKDIKVLCPVYDLIHTPSQIITEKMYKMLYKLIKEHKTTLIFTNTRSGTERVVFHLKQVMPKKVREISEDQIAAHHGSLSRDVRFDVEERLKNGELKAVVTSTSLELGIDIGYIDLVAQIGSPKSIIRCLQRIGRSGHRLRDISKGRLICMDRDDIVECAVMVREAYKGRLDRIKIPTNCLDVLAQHVMGMSIEKKWNVDEAFKLIRRSYCYRNLSKKQFKLLLKFISGGYAQLEKYKVYGKIWYDEEDEMFGRRGKYARVIYSLNIGTIPEEVAIKVYTLRGRYVGNIEEEFLERLMPGDRFILGGKVYEYISSRGVRAYVKPAFDLKPTVPSWFSEMLPLSFDLAMEIGKFREEMFKMFRKKVGKKRILKYIMENCRTDLRAANAIYQYFKEEYLYLKSLRVKDFPCYRNLFIEHYVDPGGRYYLIFHALYGRRTNDALSRAYAWIIGEKVKRNIGISVTDHGFALIFPRGVKPNVDLNELSSKNIENILRKAVFKTELMRRRFRHVAVRSLMILRNYKGHEIRVGKQQLSARKLLEICGKMKNFPVIEETFREILEDFMDIEHAKQILRKIEKGDIKIVEINSGNIPSPFSHNIILLGLSDVVLMEDRRAMLERLHNLVMAKIRRK